MLAANWPAVQVVQLAAPEAGWTLPALHALQLGARLDEYLPASQELQRAAAAAEYVPAAQSEQAVEPSRSMNAPAGHCPHSAAPLADTFPAPHLTHVADATAPSAGE